ncbi:hypothetical protein BKA64DRAFT_699946 [Cadophora sp. MPI-SDFR-AT-0126]|nr:hypothetical protein BKA64DRAFT_699946 [Leotiomycetes sp. MPI-SDFR-AT-0126]
MPKHKVHRSPNAWKKDIQVLTCLLRLRCQPPVPYSVISSLLLQTRPSLMVGLSAKVAPEVVTPEKGLQEWLENYLQNIYEKGEEWESEAWKLAREWNGDAVRDMVSSAGLGIGDGGQEDEFMVMGEEELDLQIRWRKEGDWRAGSIPLGRPTRLDVDEQLLIPISSPIPYFAASELESDLNCPFRAMDKSDMPSAPRQVQLDERRQWRHTIGAQRQKKSDNPIAPSSWTKQDDKAEEPRHKRNETKLDQLQDSDAGDGCIKPFAYFGDQGWTEMTK